MRDLSLNKDFIFKYSVSVVFLYMGAIGCEINPYALLSYL